MQQRERIQDIYPLTGMQQGILFHSLYQERARTYFTQARLVIEGRLDIDLFQKAWHLVLRRHDVLRTGFAWAGMEKPLQVVYKVAHVDLPFAFHDWRGIGEDERGARLETFLQADYALGFDLSRAPLMRISLIQTGEAHYYFIWSHHHIILDGWCLPRLVQESLLYYRALEKEDDLQLATPRPYRDFIAWLKAQDSKSALDYWRAYLSGFEELTPLVIDRPTGDADRHHYCECSLSLSTQHTEQLNAFAQGRRITLNTLVQGAWAILLSRYSGVREVLFGATMSGRPASLQDADKMIGLFINTLPVRVQVDHRQSLDDWLQALQAQNAASRQFGQTPLNEIQQLTGLADGRPLFDSLVVFENYPMEGVLTTGGDGLTLRLLELPEGSPSAALSAERNNYPLTLVAAPPLGQNKRLMLLLAYQVARFSDARIAAILDQLKGLLQAISEAPPERLLGQLGLSTPGLNTAPAKTAPGLTPFPHQFERQVRRNPDKPALVDGDTLLSYAELDALANRLARLLRTHGIGAGQRVVLDLPRGMPFVACVLAVIKAGACYVPMDPAWPAPRRAHIVKSSAAALQIVTAEAPHDGGFAAIDFETLLSQSRQQRPQALDVRCSPEQIAYVIYTSGSSGEPKGVTVSHRALASYLEGLQGRFVFSPVMRFGLVSSVAADLGHSALFGALSAGACLYLLDADTALTPERFAAYNQTHKLDVIKITPSQLRVLIDGVATCAVLPEHTLLLGGEPLSRDLAERLRNAAPACRIVNHYGPTETTVGVSTYTFDAKETFAAMDSVPIGRALAHATLYVLDDAGHRLPPGVPGELTIGGTALADGYWGQAALTAERFVPDPFSALPGARLYRSGDRVRELEEGVLEFLGRTDRQLNLNGYRVEPGEIEAQLKRLSAVDRVRVCAELRPNTDTPRLIAYMKSADGFVLRRETLIRALEKKLPEQMIPSHFVEVEQWPLNASGKLDEQALAENARHSHPKQTAYCVPIGTLETRLAELWQSVLQCERVGRFDNFFELGGDSITSLQIIARARRSGLRLTPKQIFDTPTIAGLAAGVERGTSSRTPEVDSKPEPAQGDVALTPIQHWFFETVPDAVYHWNQALLFMVPPGFQRESLARALKVIAVHHSALRLRFVRKGAQWRQSYGANEVLALERVDLSGVADGDLRDAIERACAEAQTGLNFENGPVFRALLLDAGSRRTGRLLLLAHHLVIDGLSWRILLQDIETLYRQASAGEPLQIAEQPVPYKAWSAALVRYLDSLALRSARDYWAGIKRVDLRCEYTRGPNQVGAAQTYCIVLDRETTRALLRSIHGVYRTRVDDIVLAAIVPVLCRWNHSESLTLEMESHGRHPFEGGPDVSQTVGWFTSRYPLTLHSADQRDPAGLAGLILGIKEQLRAVPDNGLGYGVLRYLSEDGKGVSPAVSPEDASVCYNNLGVIDDVLGDQAWLKAADESPGPMRAADFPRRQTLDITAKVIGGRFTLEWRYSANHHASLTVADWAKETQGLLQSLIDHCLHAKSPRLSPSDVPLSGLGVEQLDALIEKYDDVEDIYPLTPLQQGLLFHTLQSPQAGVYLNQLSLDVEGLDNQALLDAWQKLIERHAILRTVFAWGTLNDRVELPQPLQLVKRAAVMPIRIDDAQGLTGAEVEQRWQDILDEDRRRGFDLAEAPLMRLTLMRTGEGSGRLLWSRHHLLLDGWCSSKLLGELLTAYRAALAGNPAIVAPPLPYRNYIEWLARQDGQAAQRFWREQLGDVSHPTPLPLSLPTSGRAHDEVDDERVSETRCHADWTQRLQRFVLRKQLTLNTLCQGAWALLLGRLSGEREVLFGVTVSGRPADLPGVEEMLGLFINTLPLRVRLEGARPVSAWLKALQAHNSTLRQHAYCALTDIQKWSGVVRGTSLFESILVFENYPVDTALRAEKMPFKIRVLHNDERTHYPITLVVSPGQEMHIALHHRNACLDTSVAERLVSGFTNILDQMMTREAVRIGELSLLGETEREVFTQRDVVCHRVEESLVSRFEAQARLRPEAIAIRYEGVSLRYGDLNARANRVAHALITGGAGSETRVGLCCERSLGLLIGLLGILKAGAAYVPLDPGQPVERQSWMAEDAGVNWVVGDSKAELKAALAGRCDLQWLSVNEEAALSAFPETDPGVTILPDQLAYVLYTSGSTGRPKGVMVTHGQVLRLFTACEAHFTFSAEDIWSLFHAYGFDFSVWELWGGWLYGGSVVLVPEGARRSPEVFSELLISEGVTVLSQTPTAFTGVSKALIEGGRETALRYIVFGGEALLVERLTPWFASYGDARPVLVNMYGITETTVHVTYRRLRSGDSRNVIGRALNDLRTDVLDRDQQLLPPGVAGELYIGGGGLSRGYAGCPGMTAARFVPDPFSGNPGARLYRSGDKVIRQEGGELDYLGRLDDQVQLRGYRIELGEIEAQLNRYEGISSAAVLLRKDVGVEPVLVAYVASKEPIETGDLRGYLEEKLPGYMVPGRYVCMEKLPMTANGKLNREALPAPEAVIGGDGYMAPRNETERCLAAIWCEVLGLTRVGVEDNFFALGGHSLLAIRIASRVRTAFSIELPLHTLFGAVTVVELSERIQAHCADVEQDTIEALPRRDLSAASDEVAVDS